MARRGALSATGLIVALGLAAGALAGPSAATPTSKNSWSFVSEPHLHPLKLDVLVRKPGLAAGDFLLDAAFIRRPGHSSPGQSGPLIVSSRGQPVWFLSTNAPGLDFEQESYDGAPVLVFSQGRGITVLNEQYRKVATLTASRPWTIDGHDAQIVGGDIWVTVVRTVTWNLTKYGGPIDGTVIDCGLQEYQLSTGDLLATWDALNPKGRPNVPLSDSKVAVRGRLWDPYHVNSVQPLPNGDLLASMRDTWAVYLIDPSTDHILWTLGGKHSTFTLGPGAKFALQHDAKLVQPSQGGFGTALELTLFNDNSRRASAGMVLSLNTTTDRATLLDAYHHEPPLRVGVEGSMQLLPNENALVGWGADPYFSEYSASGTELLNVRWPASSTSYRALLTNTWVGTPYYPPRGAIRGATAYASWNGATEVTRWQVLAGASTHALKVVATHAQTGFETAIRLGRTYGDYEVRALNAAGQTLGTSKPFS